MKIVMIGTGNVAVVLAKKLKHAGHTILQVYGRSHAAALALAEQLSATACSDWKEITQSGNIYIIAIADKALASNEIGLQLKDQLVVHTAGAISMETLKNISSAYGVLYPFQTIRKEVEPMPEITLLVDGHTDIVKEQLMALGKTISQKVIAANDKERMQYHLCAVMINNFSNYLYTLAEDYCNRQGLDFTSLLPLIDETASRLHHFSPRQVQTGPAIRKDMSTIAHHLTMLQDEPALKHLYQVFTDTMLQFNWQRK